MLYGAFHEDCVSAYPGGIVRAVDYTPSAWECVSETFTPHNLPRAPQNHAMMIRTDWQARNADEREATVGD